MRVCACACVCVSMCICVCVCVCVRVRKRICIYTYTPPQNILPAQSATTRKSFPLHHTHTLSLSFLSLPLGTLSRTLPSWPHHRTNVATTVPKKKPTSPHTHIVCGEVSFFLIFFLKKKIHLSTYSILPCSHPRSLSHTLSMAPSSHQLSQLSQLPCTKKKTHQLQVGPAPSISRHRLHVHLTPPHPFRRRAQGDQRVV